MSKSDMQKPQNYIIVDNEDGTYSAFVNYGIFESKEDAEDKAHSLAADWGGSSYPQE